MVDVGFQDLDVVVVWRIRHSKQQHGSDDGVDLQLGEWFIFIDSCWANSRRVGRCEPSQGPGSSQVNLHIVAYIGGEGCVFQLSFVKGMCLR